MNIFSKILKNGFGKFGEKFYNKFTDFLTNGGGYALFIIALFGIALAVISHYYLLGFNLMWFLFFELPLYIFCGWALWKALRIYNQTLADIEQNEKERRERQSHEVH